MERIYQITTLGTIGGATTFASAKVENALGRIGIFDVGFQWFWPVLAGDSEKV